MELILLDGAELAALYRAELTAHFPQTELKPLAAMERLRRQGRYHPWALREEGRTLGYAMVWTGGTGEQALLDYLGVSSALRGGGLGARMLELLAGKYRHLFGEAEAPTAADPAENDLRRRRLAFYARNGFRQLDYDCALFGVHFNCLYRGPETDDGAICRWHREIYAHYFSPEHMERYIQIPLAPGEGVHPSPAWVEEAP